MTAVDMAVGTQRYAFNRIFATLPAHGISQLDLLLEREVMQADLDRQHGEAEAELAKARSDGFAAGLAQARLESATALIAAEVGLAAEIGRVEACFAQTEARIAGLAAEIAMAAAEQLAARALTGTPELAIDAAIGRVLSQTGFRETLHLHLHPATAVPIRLLLATRQSVEQRPLSIIVHEDPTLAPSDANVVWDSGGLSLDAAARNAAVRTALGLADASATPAS